MTSELPPTLSPALPAGHLLKEYSLLSVLGMGGFGITYLAADNYLQLKVAIKEFFPTSVAVRNQYSGSVALRSDQVQKEYLWAKDRFIREAQTLARFRHKNIVQVYRYFEGNGTCYMVMAYEEGMSLEQVLADDSKQWTEQSILDFALPLLDGLEAIHKAGFLHRDIKPGNILLRSSGEGPVLIDFGAARSPTSSEALTVVLSHGYGPPEQYSQQGNQGPWTDIYSMAGVLYRIVTKAVPAVSLQRVKNDSMISATFSGTGKFSEGFLSAIDLALSVDESRRPQSIGEWRQLLTRGMSKGKTSSVPAAGSDPMKTSVGAAKTDSHLDRSGAGRTTVKHRSAMTGHGNSERAWKFEKAQEPGLLMRIGKLMLARPLPTLLVLAAAAYFSTTLPRRASAPTHPNPAPGPADTAAPRVDATKSEPTALPLVRPEPISATYPAIPADETLNRHTDKSTYGKPADNDQRRSLPPEAITSCEGMSRGARCSFIDRRNESLSGQCVTPPAGVAGMAGALLVCRPERLGERPSRPPGPLRQGSRD